MKKTITLLAVFILVICLSGCGSGLTTAYGEPINELAEAVASGDTDDYLDAFEDDYIDGLEEYYNIISDKGLEATVAETLLFTREYNKENYGNFTKITLTEVSKTSLDDFPADAVYSGDFKPDGKVGEILSVTVAYVIEGISGSSEQKNATFTVYSVDGEYYLHPMHLLFVFQ